MSEQSMAGCAIDKREVKAFFDERAARWDERQKTDPAKMACIMDVARIYPGSSVLDIACGTGVMIDYYLSRDPSHITAIDISQNMADIARGKYGSRSNVGVLCGDAELYDFGRKYDCAVIYNAFPHFGNPKGLINHLSRYIKPGGTLTIAHGMGRGGIDHCHKKGTSVQRISMGLMHEDEIAHMLSDSYLGIIRHATPDIFIVSGVRMPRVLLSVPRLDLSYEQLQTVMA